MSHVDDGLIHAWLDGALFPDDPKRVAFEKHLEVCDECRTRVEAERRIRDRAADVLKSLAPDAVRVEPFEQMIARRRAERAAAETEPAARDDVPGRVDAATPITSAPSRRRRFIPLAWAASLLMAVTAGWFARAYLPAARAVSDRVAEQPVQAELSPTAGTPSRGAASEPQALPTAPAVAQGAVTSASAETRQEGAGGGAQLRDQAVGSVAANEEKLAAKTEAEARIPDTAGVMQRSVEETRRIANLMVAGDTGRLETIVRPTAAVPAAVRESAGAPALDAFRSASWETVTEAVATERLGRAPLHIEGLPIDSLSAAQAGGRWAVRVVQRLGPEGATAEILQYQTPVALDAVVVTGDVAGRAGVAADTARRQAELRQRVVEEARRSELLAAVTGKPATSAAVPEIALDVIGYRALLRADVSPDSLKALAARVR